MLLAAWFCTCPACSDSPGTKDLKGQTPDIPVLDLQVASDGQAADGDSDIRPSGDGAFQDEQGWPEVAADIGQEEGMPANTPPVFLGLPKPTLQQGESETLDLNPFIDDAQDDDSQLVVSWDPPEHVVIENLSNNVLKITAPVDWTGVELVTLTVTDSGGLSAEEDLTIGVDEKNTLGCGDILFTYQALPGVQQVLLSGTFNNWAATPEEAAPLEDDDGDDVWETILHLEPGSHQYKFIVDGEWLPDPVNPNTVDDGYGGVNSVVEVEECGLTSLELTAHETDQQTGDFHAVLTAQGDGTIEADQVAVTVDWEPAPAESVKVGADGKTLELDLEGLTGGIHDVRVQVGDETLLLKVYVGVSTDWRDAILYFVMTDRFDNGTADNDQPVADVDWRTNFQGGDFQGVIKRLHSGYFDDLGVGAIWLSWPVDSLDHFEEGGYPNQSGCGLDPKTASYSPTRYTGYHGYWPSNLYETETRFGTMDELKELVVTAHAHGIRILLDFTANHVHDSSPFFTEHQGDGYFHFPMEICQDVGWDSKPVTCWFTDYLPDLNYSNPAAVEEVLDYALHWAFQSGCDGFRLDAVKHIEFEFIQKLRSRVKKELELTGIDFYIVGETFTGDAGLIESFIGGDKIHGQFDFPANLNILKAFARQEIGLAVMDGAVREAKEIYGPGALMSNFIGNHDIARFISQASFMMDCGIWDVVSNIAQGWSNPPGQPADETPYRKLQLAFAYIMTIPGLPLIYYGDEFGMPGGGDPDNRRMMRFDDELSGHEKATLDFLQKLGQARNDCPALSKGDWPAPLWSEGDFLAYARTLPEETAVILLNLGDSTKGGELAVDSLGLPDATQLIDVLGNATANVTGGKLPFNVPARTAAIYVTQ